MISARVLQSLARRPLRPIAVGQARAYSDRRNRYHAQDVGAWYGGQQAHATTILSVRKGDKVVSTRELPRPPEPLVSLPTEGPREPHRMRLFCCPKQTSDLEAPYQLVTFSG